MGALQAQEMANSGLTLEQALEWHLRANHYPPVPMEMIPVCAEAIQLCNEGLETNEVELPLGTTYRGLTTAPAWAIVDGHHLQAWLYDIDEEWED